MLNKLFHLSARPNRMPARRGPSLALETLENRTVMSAAMFTTGIVTAYPISPNNSPELPAVVSGVPIGPGLSDSPATTAVPITRGLPDLPVAETAMNSARPTISLPGTPTTEAPVHEWLDAAPDAYMPLYVS